MRIFFFIYFLLILAPCFGQGKKGVYNTTIQNAKKVNIQAENGQIKIMKADTVFIGKIIINQTFKSKIYVLTYEESEDSLGNYWTHIVFGNPDASVSTFFDVNIVLTYQSPCEITNWEAFGQRIQWSTDCTEDKKECRFFAKQYIPQFNTFGVMIKSKKKLFPTIFGVDGAYN